MLIQLLVGFCISMANIVIHALATIVAIDVARHVGLRHTVRPRLHLMAVMIATVLVLKFAHALEVIVWGISYKLVGAAPEGTDIFYFAFVNYTTLGYGDVTPVKAWQLLGPWAAMTGIFMFGWSTAVLFDVLVKTIDHLRSISGSGRSGMSFSAGDRG